ncbi:hypothetical protein QOZ80_3AG0247820 [Eleusine coracana subsp. coracana]|nr:hypothetical protein QOZ80_3AG0247820 [Eleusine coracana subsp. coracana]
MKEGTTSVIRVDDIEPQVFKLLLSFIYSDSVMGIEEEDEHIFWQHLLVAADRYDLQRLRIMSEKKLCGSIQSTHGGVHPGTGRAAPFRRAEGSVLRLPKLPCKFTGANGKWRPGRSN